MIQKSQSGPGIDRKHAETLARLFNLSFNSAVLYGGNHQTTSDSALPLYNFIKDILAVESTVSILAERDSVYVENYCVDKIINARRVVVHFKKLGLQSVSFFRDLNLESIKALLGLMGDVESYPTADAMASGLRLRDARGIRFNYVVYRKMTTDEEVVNKDLAQSLGQNPLDTAMTRQVLDGLSEIVAAKQTLDGASQEHAAPVGIPRETDLAELSAQLRSINARIKESASASAGPGSVQEFVESVARLKRDVQENLDVIRTSHKLSVAENSVVNELDSLSHEVMLRLIGEEYRGGKVSTRRLAQITRRLMPDLSELKRMLPRIKDVLAKEGMSQADYLQFITDVLKDLESDGLSGTLESAAKDIGVTMDDLVESIKSDPADAARLIVLASEIRKSAIADDAQLSSLLTDYIERVSKSLGLESDNVIRGDGMRVIRQTISGIQDNIVDKLRSHGIGPGVIEQVSGLLGARLDRTVDGAKQEWISRFVSGLQTLGESELLAALGEVKADDKDAAALRTQLVAVLKAKGVSEEAMARLLEKAGVPRSGSHTQLPKGILNVNATQYFLEREIKRHQRYNTPFSCIIATIAGMKGASGEPRKPDSPEASTIMQEVLSHLRRVLRDLDIVGSLGLVSGDIPFVVLPMTDDAGAAKAVERLRRELGSLEINAGEAPVSMLCALSHFTFDKTIVKESRPFLEQALAHHRKIEREVVEGAAISSNK